MNCTIHQRPASTGLGDDASSAYHRFRSNARLLGTISSSFDALATGMSAAYYAALTQPAPEVWTTLVSRTAQLVQRVHALRGVLVLDAKEAVALAFFDAIVRENADLLVREVALAQPATATTSAYVSAS